MRKLSPSNIRPVEKNSISQQIHIIKSESKPKNTNVIWYDTNSKIKKEFVNGEWKPCKSIVFTSDTEVWYWNLELLDMIDWKNSDLDKIKVTLQLHTTIVGQELYQREIGFKNLYLDLSECKNVTQDDFAQHVIPGNLSGVSQVKLTNIPNFKLDNFINGDDGFSSVSLNISKSEIIDEILAFRNSGNIYADRTIFNCKEISFDSKTSFSGTALFKNLEIININSGNGDIDGNLNFIGNSLPNISNKNNYNIKTVKLSDLPEFKSANNLESELLINGGKLIDIPVHKSANGGVLTTKADLTTISGLEALGLKSDQIIYLFIKQNLRTWFDSNFNIPNEASSYLEASGATKPEDLTLTDINNISEIIVKYLINSISGKIITINNKNDYILNFNEDIFYEKGYRLQIIENSKPT